MDSQGTVQEETSDNVTYMTGTGTVSDVRTWGGSTTVSYTHLDVYKRQFQKSATVQQP